MPASDIKFEQILDKMDLHQIEQLKLAKQAITYLEGKRRQLQEQIAEMDEQMAKVKTGELDPRKVLPAASKGEKPATEGRKQRTGSLAAKIVEVLQAKSAPMNIKEIADAVLAAGYQTDSKNFQQIVGITLSKMEQLEKVERGIYKLKEA